MVKFTYLPESFKEENIQRGVFPPIDKLKNGTIKDLINFSKEFNFTMQDVVGWLKNLYEMSGWTWPDYVTEKGLIKKISSVIKWKNHSKRLSKKIEFLDKEFTLPRPNKLVAKKSGIKKSPSGKVDLSEIVYLDYNATTPLEEEVIDIIQETLRHAWGNPSSTHDPGQKAKLVIDWSRQQVAEMIGVKPSDIIFTSGGTEANNLVFYSVIETYRKKTGLKPHVISSSIEHDSVKLVLERYRDDDQIDLTFVPLQVSKAGCVSVSDVIAAIRSNTCLVSIMTANNEIGTIQPISELSHSVCKATPVKTRKNLMSAGLGHILIHTDAAQVIGKIPVAASELNVDYLTIVGHKFYAPRIGALYVRNLEDKHQGAPLVPMFYGGGQERNYRPGTENTAMIAGLGKAAELVRNNITKYRDHMKDVRDYLELRLTETFGADFVQFNGKSMVSDRLPNTSNVSFLNAPTGNDILKRCLVTQASVGAACHSGNKPSHILISIGVPESAASCALRLSVGRSTTRDDIDRVVADLKQAIQT